MAQGSALVSAQNHVEAPFIIARIGNYTFGHCSKEYKNRLQTQYTMDFPNYMESLNITKVNGTVNTYVLTMTYAITQFDDPNLLEKVFGTISNNRKIVLSYGDWNSPSFIYKEEEAVITTVTSKLNMANSSIQYVIQCTSNAINCTAGYFSFGARKAKPSDVLMELVRNKSYGLTDVFKGMSNIDLKSLIAGDDKVVQIEAKTSISILDYISYLVSCMVFVGDKSEKLKTSCYFWSVYDDFSGTYGGTYFKVIRVAANSTTDLSYNTYELDVGYHTADCVTEFSLNSDDSWSLLYDYSNNVEFPQHSYSIDNSGNIVDSPTSVLTISKTTHNPNEATRNWWSLVTQFPVTATVTMKGLLRPAMLMSYVKLNAYFYGHKHISSGLYIITKQQDNISKSGYRTTLSLTRVGGDEYLV